MMAFSQRYWTENFAPLLAEDERHIKRVRRLVSVQIGEAACRTHWERGLTMTVTEGLDVGCGIAAP